MKSTRGMIVLGFMTFALVILSMSGVSMISTAMASCVDGVKDGTETDVDCGGSCSSCNTGQTCSISYDCVSRVCVGGICRAATCNDFVRNGTETDVDCGGSCPGCAIGKICSVGSDCSSGSCAFGLCLAPTCTDRVRNGTETDMDCGGSCSSKCADGQACLAARDCVSGICNAGLCGTSPASAATTVPASGRYIEEVFSTIQVIG